MDNPYAVDIGELSDAIETAASAFFTSGIYTPIMAWGDPGLGKTEGVGQAARNLKARLIVQHVADREPTEIGGIMWERDGKMTRLAPDELPTDDEPTILFYDETPQAPLMNKNLLARVVLDRQAGATKLGSKTYVCLAGNYPHNRAGTSPMPSHLNLRLSHLHVIPNLERWREWANRRGIHPFVLGYHKHAPLDHHKFDPASEASPNPRSWKRVSDIEFAGFTGQVRKAMLFGTLGKEVADRYITQTELFRTMPDPEAVIADPRKADIPSNRSVLFALVSALAAYAKPANIGAIIEYTNRLVGDEEYQALCVREAKLRNPAITSAKAYTNWAMSPRGQSAA